MSRVYFFLRVPHAHATFRFADNVGRLSVIFLALTAVFIGLTATSFAQTAQRVPGAALPVLSVNHGNSATQPAPPAQPSVVNPTGQPTKVPEIVATVDNLTITRNMLATECLRHYGAEVLESVVNKHLIIQACNARRIAITEAEIDAEIGRLCAQFNIPQDQWLKLLESERGINPTQYKNDIIWPTLALKKLAGDRVEITDEDVQKAIEHFYGEQVRIRLIACKSLEKAKQAYAAAQANPEKFDQIAMKFSEDASAGFGGTVPPVRRHGTQKNIEQAAFSMADGQISQIFNVGELHIFIKRENGIEAQKVDRNKAAALLRAQMVDRRLRTVADQIFRELQSNVTIQNVFNDPKARLEMPDVAAVLTNRLNGQTHKIPLSHLAAVCLQRHGDEVLAQLISRNIVALEMQRRQIGVKAEEIQNEIMKVASESLPPKSDGTPDVEGWLETVERHQNMSQAIYREHVIWPRVALKKLVQGTVKVTDDDMDKGFVANYGEKVICRAIVVSDMRRAQDVWEKARANPSVEFFGNLAEEYSDEGPTRTLRGEIPPISHYSGQPTIEEEAFKLQPGELSGIIQIGESFVILKCVRHLKPIEVSMTDVHDDLYADIYEKKEIRAIDSLYQQLQEKASVYNYLSGKVNQPTAVQGPSPVTASRPSTIQR